MMDSDGGLSYPEALQQKRLKPSHQRIGNTPAHAYYMFAAVICVCLQVGASKHGPQVLSLVLIATFTSESHFQ